MTASNEKPAPEQDDCRCFAASRNSCACPLPRNVTHPLRYYEFTQDEVRALEECDTESFYQRCLPFSTFLATATYAAVKYGYLRRNPHFGAVPKVALAALVGHVAGRLSYQPACAAKLRRLPPASYLGRTMRHYHEDSRPNCKKH